MHKFWAQVKHTADRKMDINPIGVDTYVSN